MLKKILKYDLISLFKVIVIFYSIGIFFAVLTRIFLGIENSVIFNIIGKVCSGITISMLINIIINCLMRSWGKYSATMYGDESYLTHTLPVEKKTLYLGKFLSTIITMFVSIIVIGITIFIAYYSKENITTLKSVLKPFAELYNSSILKVLIVMLFILFLEFANALQAGYTGIILGHKLNNGKVGYSVVFGFLVYMAMQTINILIVLVIGLFNKDVMNLFVTNEIIDIDIIKIVLYLSIFIYLVTLVALYFINLKLFKKGVNVD